MMHRIRELREEMGLSQKELAARLNFKQQAISNYERHLRYPSLEEVRKLCGLFGVTADYLLGWSEIRTYSITEEEYALLRAFHASEASESVHGAILKLLEPFWEVGTLSASASEQGGDGRGAL